MVLACDRSARRIKTFSSPNTRLEDGVAVDLAAAAQQRVQRTLRIAAQE